MLTVNILILAVAVLAIVAGFSKGIVRQLGQLAAFIVAIVACRMIGGPLAERLMGDDPGLMRAMLCTLGANAIVFAVAYYGVRMVASMVKTVTHAVALGWLDRLAGAIFSAFKWLFLLSVVLNVWIAVSPASKFLDSDGDGVTDTTARMVIDLAPAMVNSDTARQIADIVGSRREGDNADDSSDGTEPAN